MNNEFFNAANFEWEVLGFYEELLDSDTNKVYGYRLVAEPDRPLGSAGRKEYTLTHPITVRRGPKEIVIKATAQKPVRVRGMLQVLCGRAKRKTV